MHALLPCSGSLSALPASLPPSEWRGASQMQSRLKSMGTNFLMIFQHHYFFGARSDGIGLRLNASMWRQSVSVLPVPMCSSSRAVSQVIGNKTGHFDSGVEVDWPLVRSWNLEREFFTDADQAGSKCIIGNHRNRTILRRRSIGKRFIKISPFGSSECWTRRWFSDGTVQMIWSWRRMRPSGCGSWEPGLVSASSWFRRLLMN
jgi:hypothetical protein